MTLNPQFSRKTFKRTWLSSLILSLSVIAATYGVLTGASPEIMISGTALALFIWDLLRQIVYRRKDEKLRAPIFPNRAHVQLLIFSVGTGLMLAEAGSQIQIPVPFGVVILAALLILVSLFRFYQLFIK